MDKTKQPLPPYSCIHSPNFPRLLLELGCSIALTTFQAGKLIFISAKDENQLIQHFNDFNNAMGLAIDNRRLAIATQDEVIVLADASRLAKEYPMNPNTYDALYAPQAIYPVGILHIHDLDWDKHGQLWAVNTNFSCLSIIDDHYSFRPKWYPPFIKQFNSGDSCHLNGMAMVDGMPRYVTMFSQSTTPEGWRATKETSGLIMDVLTGEVIIENLPMPHSPRWFDGHLYCLLSATGEFVKVDTDKGTYDVVARFDGFVRGLAKYGEYVFVGLSRLRGDISAFKDLPIAERSVYCGVEVLHLPTGRKVAQLRYQTTVDELYDIQIIPKLRPVFFNHLTDEYRKVLNTPYTDLWLNKDA